MASLSLELERLNVFDDRFDLGVDRYDHSRLTTHIWDWDAVVKGTHTAANCWYQLHCNFNLYVKDGLVLREEQAGNYPPRNDENVPDYNPRGCQKGAAYVARIYDPTRIKYPLRRVGKRGEGRWRRITWDEALSEIASKVVDVLSNDGPEAIVLGGGTMAESRGSEDLGISMLMNLLGVTLAVPNAEQGDEFQGAAVTFGKTIFSCSADNWYHADTILIWGGNPSYTNIPNYHFITEARYNGTKVVIISPDYSPSAICADSWIPINIGTDAALALAMAQVIMAEKLYKAEFVQEQTDLPLLVRKDTLKFLRETDLKRGGRDDIFYFYDVDKQRVVEAPQRSLELDGRAPALEGQYEVSTVSGKAEVFPVMQLLKQQLDRDHTPERASGICGLSPNTIRNLARQIAAAKGVVNIATSNFSKFYHGDLIERAIILVFSLCGHIGKKGASFNAFPRLGVDASVGSFERRGDQVILEASAADPRYARWRESGYTDEMVIYEYAREAYALGVVTGTSFFYFVHGGLLDLAMRHNSWDPHLKRPLKQYVQEALDKDWQPVTPNPKNGKSPKVMFSHGGNFLRRSRATKQLLHTLLPKLDLLVSTDWRMGTTGLYADIVLPTCSWYEICSMSIMGTPQVPYAHLGDKAMDPLYESKNEWEIVCLMAKTIERKAKERGISTFLDKNGIKRRLDNLYEKVTMGGLYEEDANEDLARDYFLNATNVENMEWNEFRDRGIVHYTGLGNNLRSIGNACEIKPGEPVVPLTWHTEKKQPYPTLTRRIQFYIDHDWYLELGEHVPTHKDNPKSGGDHPFQMTGGHARWSIHSCWIDNSLLLRLQRGEPVLFMNAGDAETRGLRDGDVVEVYNDVSSFPIHVAVSPAVRHGQVIVYHAWENYQFQGHNHFKGVQASPLNPIELVGDYFHIRPDIVTCQPGGNDRGTRVDIRKLS